MEKGVQYSWQDPGPGASSIAVDEKEEISKGGDGTSCLEKGVQYSWQDPGPGASSIAAKPPVSSKSRAKIKCNVNYFKNNFYLFLLFC